MTFRRVDTRQLETLQQVEQNNALYVFSCTSCLAANLLNHELLYYKCIKLLQVSQKHNNAINYQLNEVLWMIATFSRKL